MNRADKIGVKANETNELRWERISIHVLAGATAGIVSRTITAPLDRLKTMAQFQGRQINPIAGFHMMIKEGGYASMWRGNGANLLKVVPEITLKFAFFNEFVNLIKSNPTASVRETIVAGALTGTLSHAIVHPFEVLKTRLVLRKSSEPASMSDQVRNGYKLFGMKFAFLGLLPALLGKMLFSAIDFAAYQTCKTCFKQSTQKLDKTMIVFCGLCSSFVSLLASYPFGVLTTFRQASTSVPTLSYQKLFLKRGPFGMYSGFTNALWKTVPSYAIAYVCYESVLQIFNESMAV